MSRVHTLAGWHRGFPSDLSSCFMSRDLLDREVRRAVAILPGVETRHGHEVTALAGRDGSVDGVRCRVRGAEGGERSFTADLVVDASGRKSRAGAWLAALPRAAAEPQQSDHQRRRQSGPRLTCWKNRCSRR